MHQINFNSFSCFNPVDKENKTDNEDAIFYSKDGLYVRTAIADGAGGAGIFCGDWARFLVKKQPTEPFDSESDAQVWFLQTAKEFYDEQVKEIAKDDAFIIEKFHNEGSFSTLIMTWLDLESSLLHYWGIGDSTMFIFRDEIKSSIPILIFPICQQNALREAPRLLNWNRELTSIEKVKTLHILNNDTILMATDSISRWLIMNMMVLDNILMSELLSSGLFNSASQEKDLLEFLHQKREFKDISTLMQFIKRGLSGRPELILKDLLVRINNGELEKDDFTILTLSL